MKFALKLMVLLCLISFSGCDETTEKESSNSIFIGHNGALSIGDLALFAYDKNALETTPDAIPYTLDIIEGQMQGEKIEGLLTEVPGGDKTFFRTEIGFPFMIYPGNIVMGMPGRELGVLVGTPQLSSEYHIDEILGVYNFFQCAGTPGSPISEYRMSYGTLKLLNTENNPTWESKNNGNLSDTQVLPDKKGSWIDQGNGIIYLLDGAGRKVANLFIHPLDSNNKILVIDLCEKNISGVQLGVKQRPLTATEIAGNYKCLSVVHYEAIDISITETQIIVPEITDIQTIAHNSPWDGFIQTKDLIALPTAGAERNLYFGGTKSDSTVVPTFSTGIEKPSFYGE